MTRTPFDDPARLLAVLTRQQREVLALVANGHTNARIGRRLGVEPQSVTRYLTAIYRALGANDRAHAVAIALLTGELSRDDIQLPARRKTA